MSDPLPRPPLELEVTWRGDMRFAAQGPTAELVFDGDGKAGPSPVQTLAHALASCMASDVVLILTRGREDLKALRVHLTGWRADADPRRFTRIDLRFALAGDIHPDKVERALALSREKYCSVWHSLRQDIDFTIAFEIDGHELA
jgi:putative redox protein